MIAKRWTTAELVAALPEAAGHYRFKGTPQASWTIIQVKEDGHFGETGNDRLQDFPWRSAFDGAQWHGPISPERPAEGDMLVSEVRAAIALGRPRVAAVMQSLLADVLAFAAEQMAKEQPK